MQKLTLSVLSLSTLLLINGCANFPSSKRAGAPKPYVELTVQKVVFHVGETLDQAQMRQFGKGGLTMVNVHDDEQASVDAGVAVLEQTGGRLIELTHTGKRGVVFDLNGKQYSIDPNRIFSKEGVRKTVRREDERDGKVPEEAFEAVDRFAWQFIRHFNLHKQRAFIALHNNGDSGLSIHTYEPGGDWAADTDELHVSSKYDPDEFFFVTDKRYFDELKKRDFNVILQDNSIKRDDGSLSVFAGRHGIPYINVEAQPDHFEEQVRMTRFAWELMR